MTAALIIVVIIVMCGLFATVSTLLKIEKLEKQIYCLRDEIHKLRDKKPTE